MDLRTLNTLKAGDRIKMTKDHKDVGIRAGEVGTVVATVRDPETPEFPTVYIELNTSRPELLVWENVLVLTPDCYCDLTDEDRGLDTRIDLCSVVACMERTEMPPPPADEQGRRWAFGKAEAA
jgi:hypothetical protein